MSGPVGAGLVKTLGGKAIGKKEKSSSTQHVTGNSSSISRPVAPDGWEDAWREMRSQLSPDGFTSQQREGVDWMSAALQGGDPAGLDGIRSQLDGAAAYWKDAADNRPSNTLASLATRYPQSYRPLRDVTAREIDAGEVASSDVTPADITSQGVSGRDIAAQRGSQFMSDYQNPYMRDVVDTSLADYDRSAAEARNALRAGTAGAFGNKRTGVAEGQFAADSALGRGRLAAELRSGGFNTAAALGMQDADRSLSADQANQSTSLQAALANAANRLAADQFNAGQRLDAQQFNAGQRLGAQQFNAGQRFTAQQLNAANDLAAQQFNNEVQNRREMFDVDAGYRGYEMRDNARRALESNLGARAGLGQQRFQTNADIAQALIGAGGIGQGQNLAWLAAGAPLFGERSDASQSGTTATKGRLSSKGGEISSTPPTT